MAKFKAISKRIVIANNSASEFDKLIKLTQLIDEDMVEHNKPWYFRATNNASEIRNNAQNALYACYINEVSKHFGDNHKDVRSHLKRKFGLNVLLIQSKDNTKAGHEAESVMSLLSVIEFKLLEFMKQELVLEPLPCTSIMTSKNFQSFLRQVELYYNDKGLVFESVNERLRRDAGL